MCHIKYSAYDHMFETIHEAESGDSAYGIRGVGNCPRCSQAVEDLVSDQHKQPFYWNAEC